MPYAGLSAISFSVVDAEWGAHREVAIKVALTELRAALDALELAEPAIHAELVQSMERVAADLQDDLSA